MSNTLTSKVSGRMSSRGWAIALGIGAVVLAAILLVVYLDRYRARVGGRERPDAGARREAAHSRRHARLARGEPVDVRPDDASAEGGRGRSDLRSRPTSADGPRPQRSSRASSSRRPTSRQVTPRRSTRRSRARSVRSRSRSTASTEARRRSCPATPSTCTCRVAGGVKLFEPNVKVLTTPTFPGPAGGGNLILRIETQEAAKWAFANDNASFWFVIRPVVGAKPTKPSTANASTLLR